MQNDTRCCVPFARTMRKVGLSSRSDRALRHHLDQIGAIVRRSLNVAHQPARGNRDAGWGNLEYPALAGIGNVTCVMISPSVSAVENRPLKKSSADIERLLVVTVAPSASTAAG